MMNSIVVWARVSGPAVGYIVGNVVPLHGGSSVAARGSDSIKAVPGEAMPPDGITETPIADASANAAGDH